MSDDGEVRNVVARLAQYADGGTVDQYVDLFTPDASWEMPGGPRKGQDDIRAGAEERRATGGVGPGSNTRHVVTTVSVDVDGDTAVSESVFLYYVDTATAPKLQLMGTYIDHLVRTPAGWKMARRQISFG